MWMDIAIGLIIVLSAGFGYRSGFVKTFLHMIGWILSIVLGYIWHPQVKAFLMEKTNYYTVLQESVSERLNNAAGAAVTDNFDNIPDVLQDAFKSASESLSQTLADTVASLFFTIISMVIIIVGIKLIFWLIIQLFSKTKNEGFIAFSDGMLGLVFGFVKGLLLVLVFLALLVPVSNFADTSFFTDAIAESQVSKILYNSNPILLFLRGFF